MSEGKKEKTLFIFVLNNFMLAPALLTLLLYALQKVR